LGIIAPFGEMCGVCEEAELLAESCAHHSPDGNCALELVAVAHVQKDIEPGAASTAAMGNGLHETDTRKAHRRLPQWRPKKMATYRQILRCGPYRARTDDIHGVNVALYQLS
jgi:hypothetical protein